MALENYREKRRFDKTPEPTGGSSESDKLIFVVQKHAASHLHYDFRLELRGVLKSWAVPKGPSMNPEDHRLAQEVEDHPFDYKDFEGIIPKGQYGGGTVIVWDQGTYEPAETIKGKKEQEHWISSHYWKNSLRIKLKGKKLKGEFHLTRAKERGANSWLLTKVGDKHATDSDITLKDKSVVSGLTIEQMAQNQDANVWQSNRKDSSGERSKRPKNVKGKKIEDEEFPDKIAPMLCTLTREPTNDSHYIYEVKWDGYRIVSYVQEREVRLDSRGGVNYTERYPLVREALEALTHDLIVDGEIVVFNKNGDPDFDALQLYNGNRSPIAYCIFDLLWLDGHNLMGLPLYERKNLLKALIGENDVLRFSESYEDGDALYREMLEKGWEGIVAKKNNSQYVPGERGSNWLKTPTQKRQEFVIGAWAESDKGRTFRSLIFGAYNNKGDFEWIGRSGGGFKDKEMPGILKRLKSLETKESPFINKILDTKGTVIHYVKPELVANFAFATWTKSGRIRKPATFLGFRSDKDPRHVIREIPLDERDKAVPVHETLTSKASRPGKGEQQKQAYLNEDTNWKEIDKLQIEDEHDLPVGNDIVKVHNLGRELWKKEGVRKVDLLSYYGQIAQYILPYLRRRPLSLHLKHVAPTAPGMYIKDMEGRQPHFADVFSTERKHAKKGKRSQIDYLVCNNQATLLYAVDLGAIDLNPWSSTTQTPNEPDYIIIDLDPSDNDFKKAIEAAKVSGQMLDYYKLKGFVKTSGKTGIHVLVPCSGFNFQEARKLGSYLCDMIHRLIPEITTRETEISRRGELLFVDDSQNDFADTIAAAYSVRPYRVPMVSTPLDWKEINDKLDPTDFTIHTIQKRLDKKGDLLKGLFDRKTIASNNTRLNNLLNHPPF